MSYTPPTSPNLYPCGLAASGISGYKQLAKPPLAAAAEVDLTQEVVVGDGEVLMQAWVTTALGLTEIAAGDWVFSIFGSVDTVDGSSEIVMRVYSRTAAGTETELFDVTTGSLTASAALYSVVESGTLYSLAAVTDRLVVKFFAKTSSATTRTVHLYYLGEANQTRLSLPVELVINTGGDMAASLYDTDLDGQIGGSGHTIQDEGTDLAAQANMNFTGAGVAVTNNTGTGATDITIPGATIDPWVPDANTWSYSAADAPTFVISVNADMTGLIGVGYRIRLTQATLKYFIVTAVGAYSGGATLITVYGGTDYTLADAAISSPSYSFAKAPLGFPMSPVKWTVEVTDVTQRSQATPIQNTWYNLGSISISIPIGVFTISTRSTPHGAITSGTTAQIEVTLSTANNSESDNDFTCRVQISGATGGIGGVVTVQAQKTITLSSKTAYYINTRTVLSGMANIYNRNEVSKLIIRAVCALL